MELSCSWSKLYGGDEPSLGEVWDCEGWMLLTLEDAELEDVEILEPKIWFISAIFDIEGSSIWRDMSN